MAGIAERVKGFIEVWEKRKAGELPQPDLRMNCQLCGVQVMGDEAVQFTRRGLLCASCMEKD